ncbi:MAG TPA: sulfite exporter TauE/SafE family protein [Burkholderiales bacterium]|nr:sulfite exporter TauE/SafE family protein [Burkholderiales bacterium]
MPGDLSQLFIALGIFAGAVVSGFTGFAFSAVAGAVLLHVLPPREAVPLMMVCSVLVQSLSLFSLRRHIEWRGSLRLILGGLAGLPPALYVLLYADPALLRIGFGIFLAGYAAYMLLRPAVHPFRQAALRYDAVAGLAGGLIGGVTAMPGAIPAIWCELRGLAKDRQRGLVQPYITAMQIAALAFLAAQSGISVGLSSEVLHSLAPLGAGTMLGLALFGRVSDSQFRRVLLSTLMVCGLAYLV